MYEIARVTLDNEMDLILAHKRSMKLAELSGLSLSAQTTFATAVSEVSRSTIENSRNGCLILGIDSGVRKEKYIVAHIKDEGGKNSKKNTGVEYAKRLVNKLSVSNTDTETLIELFFTIPGPEKISAATCDEWKSLFTEELPVSPYDEIKRKNEQLRDLAQKLQESENQYKTLTNSLPLIIFSLDANGKFVYANEWLQQYTGLQMTEGDSEGWRSIIHHDDYASVSFLLNDEITSAATGIKTQIRLKHAGTNDYFWHLLSISPLKDEKGRLTQWIGYCVDIHAQKVYEQTLQDNKELKEIQAQLEENKEELERNVKELNRSNLELQQFAFVASHDLQEPVRKVAFYSDYLLNKYGDTFDKKGKSYLNGMFSASTRMRNLIHDVLSFSQVTREKTQFGKINMDKVVKEALLDLEVAVEEKKAVVDCDPLPVIEADHSMMVQLIENLLSNAVKYSKEGVAPRIRISSHQKGSRVEISVKDNGIGFDEKYASKLFTLFQRLHAKDKYEGTGLGLAICHKIVELHGGKITARGKPDEGATFIINLPLHQ